jgi:hypothetical protein
MTGLCDQIIAGNETEVRPVGRFRPEKNFSRALEKAKLAWLLEFDSAYFERQAIWGEVKKTGLVDTRSVAVRRLGT